jgi:hypothetical protein
MTRLLDALFLGHGSRMNAISDGSRQIAGQALGGLRSVARRRRHRTFDDFDARRGHVAAQNPRVTLAAVRRPG